MRSPCCQPIRSKPETGATPHKVTPVGGESWVDSLDGGGTMAGMSDYPTVDRVIADLKRLSAGFWHTDREREIGNVMVDARHCLEQLSEEVATTGKLLKSKELV
jgi:hypothetical protein